MSLLQQWTLKTQALELLHMLSQGRYRQSHSIPIYEENQCARFLEQSFQEEVMKEGTKSDQTPVVPHIKTLQILPNLVIFALQLQETRQKCHKKIEQRKVVLDALMTPRSLDFEDLLKHEAKRAKSCSAEMHCP